MGHFNKVFYSLLVSGILSLILLAGCGSGKGNEGNNDNGKSTVNDEIKSSETYTAYTNSDGIAEFTLSDSLKIQQKVVDLHTNNPIIGAKVVLFINKSGDSTVMVWDPNDIYAPQIYSYESSATNSLRASKTLASISITTPVTFTVGLITFHEARLKKDSLTSGETGPLVPLDQSKLPEGIDVTFVRECGNYIYSTTLEELSNISPSTLYEGVKEELKGQFKGDIDDVLTTILIDSGIKVAEVTGKVYEKFNPVIDITEAALNAQLMGNYIGNILRFKLLGYPPDTIIDVYDVERACAGLSKKQAHIRIMVPKSDTPLQVSGMTSIFGQITNAQGQPISSAKIWIEFPDRPPSTIWTSLVDYVAGVDNSSLPNKFKMVTSTDELGFFTTNKLPIFGYEDNAYLTVIKEGYMTVKRPVKMTPDTSIQLNIALQPRNGKGTIFIKDSKTNQAVVNAAIRIYDANNDGGFRGVTSDYDPDGTYHPAFGSYYFNDTVGTYRVVISKLGYRDGEFNYSINEFSTPPLSVFLDPSQETTLSDLTVSAAVASNFTAAESVYIPVSVSRSGGNLTFEKNVEVGVYWSTNSVWDSSDTLLWYDNANYTIDSLNTNGEVTIPASFTIPSVPDSKTYYLIMVVDKNNYHSESNKFNNIAVYPVNVQTSANIPPNPVSDLRVTPLSSDRIALYWSDNAHNETGFRIERKIGTTGIFTPLISVDSSIAYYEDSGLTSSTQYLYRVMAYNSYGDSALYSNEISATTLPNIALTSATTDSASNISLNSATLNGSINPNGTNTGYFFQWGTNPVSYGNLTANQIVGNGNNSVNVSSNVTGLSPNTLHYYRIVAVNDKGGTVFGDQRSFRTNASGSTTNSPPVISSVKPNPYPPVTVGSTVSITCAASDPDGDALSYSWTSSGGSFSGSISGSVITWVASSTIGTYTVDCSVSDGRVGSDSEGISISVISSTTVTPPVAPSNLIATAMGQNSITLTWQDNSDNETGFKIERKTGSSGTYAQIALWPAQASYGSGGAYDDTSLTAGTTYCYRVSAYNTYDSSHSNENCATTQSQQTIKPAAITGTASNTTSNSATLNGTINPNGVLTSAFFIWDTKTPPLANLTIPTQNYSGTSNVSITANISGLTPNTLHYFRIVAVTSTETVYGDPVAFTTSALKTNNSPVISSIVSNPVSPVNVGSTLTITCASSDPDGDALSYNWTSSGGSFSGSSSGSVVTWIAPSTVGTYQITCSVSDGNGGTDSEVISISVISSTTVIPPAAPTTLSATAMGQNSITLAWQDNADNETGFKIERKTGSSGTFAQIATAPAKSGSGSGAVYDDSGLTANTTYCYRVLAYNTAGDSSYTSENCATTWAQQSVKPTATTGTASNITSNSATLNSTINPNGVPTSAFFVWDTKTPPLANLTTATQNYSGTSNVSVTANITSLTPNTLHYFRIVAVTSTETVYGDPVAFTTAGERIANGSFSSGTSGWTLVGDFWAGTNLTRYLSSPGYASGGVDSSGATKNNANGNMSQTVTIPSGATSATLSFWLNITSDETTSINQYDKLYVDVLNSSGTVLATLASYSNLDKGPACGSTCTYNQKTFNLLSYKGQTIQIRFRATTDDTNFTVFRIDDVSLMTDG